MCANVVIRCVHRTSYGDHHRVTVGLYGMYLSCRDPVAIIYRGVLIFSRLTVEISISSATVAVLMQKG